MKQKGSHRIKLVLVGVVVAFVLGGGRTKADYAWMQKTDMPTTRRLLSTSVVRGKICARSERAFQL